MLQRFIALFCHPFTILKCLLDVRSSDECFKWMQSYNDYADDLLNEGSYMASLSRSCALVMNEFYEGIRVSNHLYYMNPDVWCLILDTIYSMSCLEDIGRRTKLVQAISLGCFKSVVE